jgi:hypothetical protein
VSIAMSCPSLVEIFPIPDHIGRIAFSLGNFCVKMHSEEFVRNWYKRRRFFPRVVLRITVVYCNEYHVCGREIFHTCSYRLDSVFTS